MELKDFIIDLLTITAQELILNGIERQTPTCSEHSYLKKLILNGIERLPFCIFQS